MNRSDVLNSLGIALCISYGILTLGGFLLNGIALPTARAIVILLPLVIVLTGLTLRKRDRR